MTTAEVVAAEGFSADEDEVIIRFLLCYAHKLERASTGHGKAQRALLRRMIADLGVDYGDILREIVPTVKETTR